MLCMKNMQNNKMNILVDISHPAQLNFFKNVIKALSQNGDNVIITSIKRGKLQEISAKELPGFCVKYVGSHSGNKLSIVLEANLFKFFRLLLFLINKKVDVGVSVGGFVLGFVLKIYRVPNIQYDDDPESSKNFLLERLTSTELFLPLFSVPNKKIRRFKALKEWAYLSPKYFTPAIKELDNYNLEPQRYIFVREVSTGSLNYANQQSNIIATFARDLPHNYYRILLSLEDKSTINQYPSDWILLEEPLSDIHSLIYFSKVVISSGDSMAREGAMLGVPSIYCGIREMAANKVMIDKGMLFHKNVKDVPRFVEQMISSDIKIEEQDKFRERLEDEWVDVTGFIIETIKRYQKG